MAAYIRPALEAGLIEMTVPDRPRSHSQRYRLTSKGRQFLVRDSGESGGAADHANGHANDHDSRHDSDHDHVSGHVVDQVNDQATDHVRQLVTALTCEMDRAQLQAALQSTHRPHFMAAFIRPALEAGLIEMTIPDKPRSRNQRYHLTPAGRKLVRSMQ